MTQRTEPATASEPAYRPNGPVDLKTLVQKLAAHRDRGAPTTGAYRRTVRQLERMPASTSHATPLPVIGFLDGIQRLPRVPLARFESRDVTCVYLAAGTTRSGQLLNVEERLSILCSVVDEGRIRAILPDAPVTTVPDVMPWHIPLATAEWVDATRRSLEAAALASAPDAPGRYVVIDGSLPLTDRQCVVSVVKSPEAELLLDPDLLPTKAGWRSPALLLPAARYGELDRVTAFVRLRDTGGHRPWNWSLVRVEVRGDAEDPLALLDRTVAMAMTQLQPLGAEPRAAVHLRGFADCEAALRARTPVVITHLA